MRQNPHVRICGGPGSATTLVYPTPTRCRGGHTPVPQSADGSVASAASPADLNEFERGARLEIRGRLYGNHGTGILPVCTVTLPTAH